jgi:hypothetical protein
MKVWKLVKNTAPFFGTAPVLANAVWRNADQRALLEGGELCELAVCLVGQVIAVRQEEDARTARRFATRVPACLKQLFSTARRGGPPTSRREHDV